MAGGDDSSRANSRLSLAFAVSVGAHAALLVSFATHGGLPGGDEQSAASRTPRLLAVSLRPASARAPQSSSEVPLAQAPATVHGDGGRDDGGGPRPLTPIVAAYPEGALALGISAKVEVRAIVDESGRVEQASVVSATLADVFDGSALSAVRATRFIPATAAGHPVKSAYRAVIFYDLK